jgi:hypothetical protein
MSAGQITDHDCPVILDPNFCYFHDHRMSHLVGTGLDWLCLSSAALASLAIPAIAASATLSFYQWHHWLGHICGS